MRPLDTAPKAEKVQLEVLRRMGPERRLEAAIGLSQTCRELLMEGVRRRQPEYHVGPEAAREALERQRMFNVVHSDFSRTGFLMSFSLSFEARLECLHEGSAT